MALEARTRVRVGRRDYYFGERLSPEHEAEIRRRPAFSLLMEEGHLAEIEDAPTVLDPPPQSPDSAPVDPVLEALNAALEPSDTQTDAVPPQTQAEKEFACPHCDYSTDKKVNLNAHIRRNHKVKKGKVKRKR